MVKVAGWRRLLASAAFVAITHFHATPHIVICGAMNEMACIKETGGTGTLHNCIIQRVQAHDVLDRSPRRACDDASSGPSHHTCIMLRETVLSER